MSNKFFWLSVFCFAATLKSYSKPCPEVILPPKNLKDIAEVRDNIEEPPFMMACKDPPNLLKGRPKTGIFVRTIVENDSQGRSTRDLFKKNHR